MEIQALENRRAYTATAAAAGAAKTEENAAAQTEQKKAEDSFVKTETTGPVTYQPPKKLSTEQKNAISEQQSAAFQQMLVSMLGKQGEAYNFSMGAKKAETQQLSGAAAAIGPGGAYSVEAVATRILDMAKSLAGGDTSKIALLRDAVEKGFKAAGVELGGKLPSICNDTHKEVMKRFDEWENGTETA